MQVKEYIVKKLYEFSAVSNKIRWDMLKNFLYLPLVTFIENMGSWLRDFGVDLEEEFISWENQKVIEEKIKVKFEDGYFKKKSKIQNPSNFVKTNSYISNQKEDITSYKTSKFQKYQIFQHLVEDGDFEAMQIYNFIQTIIGNPQFKSKLILAIQNELKLETSKPEDIISCYSKKFRFVDFIANLYNDANALQNEKINKILSEKSMFLRKDMDHEKYASLANQFKQFTNVEPIYVIFFKKYGFFGVKEEDFFISKPRLKKLRQFWKNHEIKILILSEFNPLESIIFSTFKDYPIDSILMEKIKTIEKHLNQKKKELKIHFKCDTEIDSEIVNEFFEKHVILSDKLMFESVKFEINHVN